MSQGVIEIAEAEGVLAEMLAGAGVELPAADPRKTWSVFKDFCRTVEVRTPEDMVFFEIGVFDFLGSEQFCLHFWRQFEHPKEDQNDEAIVLDCEFRYDPADELRSLGTWGRWSEQDTSLEDFFASVERRPYLETASRHRAVDVKIVQFQV
jgi:hypothetical protein